MKNEEAKFILSAFRPDGRDAEDTIFGPALAQAGRDPELCNWFETQRKLDAAFAAKLQHVNPPSGLRDAILAGVHASASRTKRNWWTTALWPAAAAVGVIIATLSFTLRSTAAMPTILQLATFSMSDLANSHDDHLGYSPILADAQAQLGNSEIPFTRHLTLDVEDLRKRSCRSVRFAGCELLEVCFQHSGTWYHVYVGQRSDFASGPSDPRSLTSVSGQFASTAWTRGKHVYALVTRAGSAALQRVIVNG